jgi:hypothetical protein
LELLRAAQTMAATADTRDLDKEEDVEDFG